MALETCETVKVKCDNEWGHMVINKSDMTDEHELFLEDGEVASDAPKARGKKPKAE